MEKYTKIVQILFEILLQYTQVMVFLEILLSSFFMLFQALKRLFKISTVH